MMHASKFAASVDANSESFSRPRENTVSRLLTRPIKCAKEENSVLSSSANSLISYSDSVLGRGIFCVRRKSAE